MGILMLVVLQVISLLFYGMVVVLSIIPLNPTRGGTYMYIIFVLFGTLFYVLGTAVHCWLTPALFENVFSTWRRRLPLAVLPVVMLVFVIYVYVNGT